jgi:subfamily B ATP-binding cassette protein MsbA
MGLQTLSVMYFMPLFGTLSFVALVPVMKVLLKQLKKEYVKPNWEESHTRST